MAGPINPDQTLDDLRQALAEYRAYVKLGKPNAVTDKLTAADRVARHAAALDGWLTGGGPLPRDWRGASGDGFRP